MKPRFNFLQPKRGFVAFAAAFAATLSFSPATTFIWDADPAVTGAQDGSGVWTANSTNFWTGSANASPVKSTSNNNIIQIGNTASGGTVTINNGGALLNYSDSLAGATNSTPFNINRSYTIAGAAAGDGLAVGNITIASGLLVNISAQLTGGTGAGPATPAPRNWTINGSTLNLSGGGRLQNMYNGGAAASIVNVTGTWLTGGLPATGSASTDFTVGGNGTGSQPAVLTVNQNAGSAVTAAQLRIGGGNNQNSDNVSTYNLNGGTLNTSLLALGNSTYAAGVLSKSVLNVNGGSYTNTGELRLGNDGSGGTVNVSGGTVTSSSNLTTLNRYGSALNYVVSSLNISGGVTKMSQIQFGRSTETYLAKSSASVNLSGGSLYLSNATAAFFAGSNSPNLASSINLSGGTLGATANWATAMNINLTNANGGVTLRSADEAGTARNITLNGNLEGAGTLKIGKGAGTGDPFGTVLIAGLSSTYSGNTVLSSGALQTGVALPNAGFSSLGTGDVTVAAGTFLQLQNNQSINDSAKLTFDINAPIDLNFAGIETIGGLTIKGKPSGDIVVPPGTYTADDLFNLYEAGVSGGGVLKIVAAGYTSWAATNAGGQAANLDYDGDGVPNGVEYFFGATGSSFTANPSVVNGKITWPMSASATGVTYKVQTSTTLAAGGWTDVSQASLVVTPGTPTGSVSYTLPTGLPKAFYRLVVTTP
jgi:autotransporter-associated beta strand protein